MKQSFKRALACLLVLAVIFPCSGLKHLVPLRAKAFDSYSLSASKYYYCPTSGYNYVYLTALSMSSSSDSDAKQRLSDNGYTPVGNDFNAGDERSDSKYVHLGVTYTNDPDLAVKSFKFSHDDQPSPKEQDSYSDILTNGNSCTFYKVGSGACVNTPADMDGAVNLNEGNEGDDIKLYLSADNGAGPPITDIKMSNDYPRTPAINDLTYAGYTVGVRLADSSVYQDCNQGVLAVDEDSEDREYNFFGYKCSCPDVTSALRSLLNTYNQGCSLYYSYGDQIYPGLSTALSNASAILADYDADGWSKTYSSSSIISAERALPQLELSPRTEDFTFQLNADHTGYIVENYTGSDQHYVEVPAVYRGLPVVELGEKVFINDRIDIIYVPEGVKSIGSKAFSRRSSFSSYYTRYPSIVILPISLEYIAHDAFYGCRWVEKVLFNGTLSDWCQITFENTYSNPLTYGNSRLFLAADPAQGDNVDYVFSKRQHGTCYTAADYDEDLCYSQLPNEVEVPAGVNTLKPFVFDGFYFMESVVLPASVNFITADRFLYCSQLKNIWVDSENPTYSSVDGVLYNKAGNSLVLFPRGRSTDMYVIGDQTSQIAAGAFYYANKVKNIIIPPSVRSMSANSFKSGQTCYCKEDSFAHQFFVDNGMEYGFYADLILNPNGGVCEDAKKILFLDSELGTLPVPEKEGCTFLGWYNEPNGGVKLEPTDLVTSTADRTAYACWVPTTTMKCGDDLYWELDGNKLIISGKGEMYDYPNGEVPWGTLGGYITEIEISEKTLSLCDHALDNLGRLEKINCRSPFCVFPKHYDKLTTPQIIGYSGNNGANIFTVNFRLPFTEIEGDYGNCGEGLKWLYNDDAKTLSILYFSGSGAMNDYGKSGNVTTAPWNNYRNSIKTVKFDESVSYIGNNAFYNCTSVERFVFPSTLSGMGSDVVEGTKWYRDRSGSVVAVANLLYAYKVKDDDVVTLGNGINGVVYNFGKSIRESGEGPEKIQISRSASVVQDGALAYNKDLKQIFVDNGNKYFKSVNNVLYTKDGTELVCYPAGLEDNFIVPDSVTKIRPYAFAGCTNLTKVTIGKNVTDISPNSFEGTSLQTIYGYAGSRAEQFAQEYGCIFKPYTSVVTFDCNGGTVKQGGVDVGTYSVPVSSCMRIGDLIVPEREKYVFLGWYYETDDEDILVTESFIVNGDVTLYAYWEKIKETVPYVTSISIAHAPAKTTYFAGDDLDTNGMVISAVYSDGSVKNMSTGFYCVPYRLSGNGMRTVTVYFSGQTATFEVGVAELVPVSVSVIKLPDTTTYYIGDNFNGTGMIAAVEYNNGEIKNVINPSLMDYDYDFSQATDKSVIGVSFTDNGRTVSTSLEVVVINSPSVYSEPISTDAGDYFVVPVYVRGNGGLMGYAIDIDYDPQTFSPVSVDIGNISGSINNDIGYGKEGRVSVIWNDSEEHSEDGLLFTVTFKALNKARSGSYPFEISYSRENTFDNKYDEVTLVCSDTTVTVLNEVIAAEIHSADTTASFGEIFNLPVYIENNAGIVDLSTLLITYDAEKFEYIGIDQYDPEILVKSTNKPAGNVKFVLNEIEPEFPDGLLMNLKFRALKNTSGTYNFGIELSDVNWRSSGCQVEVIPSTEAAVVSSASDMIEIVRDSFVEIPVQIKNNPGLMGIRLDFSYDCDQMNFVDVAADENWQGSIKCAGNSDGTVRVVYTGTENVYADGTMFFLIFDTDGKYPCGESRITVTCDRNDTFNENWTPVSLECEDISVKAIQQIINVAESSTTIIKDGFIYGLPCGISTLDNRVEALEGFALEYDSSAKIGTGTVITAKRNGKVAETGVVVIFGDVDGDAWYDGTDAYFVRLVASGMISESALTDAQRMAADCNHDGVIDSADVALLEQAGLLLAQVDQTLPQEELQANSAYLEYCGLIDQSIEITEPDQPDVTEEPATEQGSAANVWQIILDLFKRLVNFVTMIFSIVVLPK